MALVISLRTGLAVVTQPREARGVAIRASSPAGVALGTGCPGKDMLSGANGASESLSVGLA